MRHAKNDGRVRLSRLMELYGPTDLAAIDLPLRKEFGAVILKAFDKRRSPGPEDQPLGGER